ncbi:MAG: hypothetical protein RRA94_04055 [Bacteroidota bacterium]|nr:hypothetical protein [Bacteroidota bacterium]
MKIRITGNVIGIVISKDGTANVNDNEASRLVGLGVAEYLGGNAPDADDTSAGKGRNTRRSKKK